MNRGDLANLVAEEHGVSKTQAGEIVSGIFDHIAGSLANGGLVLVSGFGTFKPVAREAREARNPKTNEPVKVPARTAVKFKAAKELQSLMPKPKAKKK